MRQKSGPRASSSEQLVRDIRRATRKHHSAEDKIRIVLDGLRGAAPAIVTEIALFDLYQGKGIADAEKSFAFRIVMQDTERTLEDQDVEAVVAKLIGVAVEQFGGALRS